MTNAKRPDNYPLRFEDGLKLRLQDAAKQNRRSLNAEINLRLQNSFVGEAPEETADPKK